MMQRKKVRFTQCYPRVCPAFEVRKLNLVNTGLPFFHQYTNRPSRQPRFFKVMNQRDRIKQFHFSPHKTGYKAWHSIAFPDNPTGTDNRLLFPLLITISTS